KGNGELFTREDLSGGQLPAVARGSNGAYPRSNAGRVRAPRNEPTLFDFLPANQAADEAQAEAEIVPFAVPPTPTNAAEPRQLPDTRPDDASPAAPFLIASGEKAKCRDILAAIRAAKRIEEEQRLATEEERQTLSRFAGFGPVAL